MSRSEVSRRITSSTFGGKNTPGVRVSQAVLSVIQEKVSDPVGRNPQAFTGNVLLLLRREVTTSKPVRPRR